MKVPIHNIFKAGMSIYILFLAFGLYFSAANTAQEGSTSIENILVIADLEEPGDNSLPSKKGFNSRPVIEDDDDSAKDLFHEVIFERESFITIYPFHSITYSSFEEDTTTPPPRG